MPDPKPRNSIQVIARAAEILRICREDDQGLSLGQIAERVKLPRSTVQRIVGSLASENWLVSGGGSHRIRIGPGIGILAGGPSLDVVGYAQPHLKRLSEATGETVDLSVFREAHMVFIDQIAGTQRLRAVSSVGEKFPLTTTANGKACLAMMADETIACLVHTEWARTGIDGDLAAFLSEIGEARKSGLSYDHGQHTPGISAVGIGFANWKGDKFAISIPTPTARFERNSANLIGPILETRKKLTELMSG